MDIKGTTLRIGLVVVLFALAGSLVSAEPPDPQPDRRIEVAGSAQVTSVRDGLYQQSHHYMVKFICGRQEGVAYTSPVRPGDYATAINIHNHTDHRVKIYRKPSLHYTPYTAAPPAFSAKGFWIRPGRVLEIDCTDIYTLTRIDAGTWVKGMMHLGMDEELPVVAVYTVATGDTDGDGYPDSGPSIDVEDVPAGGYVSSRCVSDAVCATGYYCAKETGDCTGIGTCEEYPSPCPDLWDPVCTCDGLTYMSACHAAEAGVNVDYAGECTS